MKRLVVLCVPVLLAAAAGIAYATVPTGDGVFNACMLKPTGTIRMVDPSAPTSSLLSRPCNETLETPIRFNERGQTGATGPQGPPGETIHGYRENRGLNGEIRVTGVGTDQFGFPTDTHTGLQSTDVVTLQLPPGVYYVQWSVSVRKDSGAGIFSCFVGDKTIDFYTGSARTALGAEAGFARWASLSAPGFYNLPTGGTLTLICWQAADQAVPGTPSGEDPTVFQANINVLPITRATITNFVTGGVSNIP